MSEYKRYISYLYRYEDSISSDNVGFVKLEAKSGEVKLSINLKTHEISNCELKIGVLYNRDVLEVNKESNIINEDIEIIDVETIKCIENRCSVIYRTSMTNVFDSGVSVERLVGVIVQTNTNKKFISKWNNKDINIKRVMDKHSNDEDESLIYKDKADETEKDVIMNLNDFNESRIVRSVNYQNEEENQSSNDTKTESLAKKIFKHYPGMYPFEDDEILECVKLEPHDIGIFSMDKWPLANNSFLLHGYYTYRHLIFAKMRHNNKPKYVLGVPGIFRDRERFMANMFGFRGFKGVRNKPLGIGEFGYWYLEIKL